MWLFLSIVPSFWTKKSHLALCDYWKGQNGLVYIKYTTYVWCLMIQNNWLNTIESWNLQICLLSWWFILIEIYGYNIAVKKHCFALLLLVLMIILNKRVIIGKYWIRTGITLFSRCTSVPIKSHEKLNYKYIQKNRYRLLVSYWVWIIPEKSHYERDKCYKWFNSNIWDMHFRYSSVVLL